MSPHYQWDSTEGVTIVNGITMAYHRGIDHIGWAVVREDHNVGGTGLMDCHTIGESNLWIGMKGPKRAEASSPALGKAPQSALSASNPTAVGGF